MKTKIMKLFRRDDRGISAIEYAFLAIAIGLVVLSAAGPVGNALKNRFNDIATQVNK